MSDIFFHLKEESWEEKKKVFVRFFLRYILPMAVCVMIGWGVYSYIQERAYKQEVVHFLAYEKALQYIDQERFGDAQKKLSSIPPASGYFMLARILIHRLHHVGESDSKHILPLVHHSLDSARDIGRMALTVYNMVHKKEESKDIKSLQYFVNKKVFNQTADVLNFLHYASQDNIQKKTLKKIFHNVHRNVQNIVMPLMIDKKISLRFSLPKDESFKQNKKS